MVSTLAPGPWIIKSCVMLCNSPLRVIVPVTPDAKAIVSPADDCEIASLNEHVPRAHDPRPSFESAVVLTTTVAAHAAKVREKGSNPAIIARRMKDGENRLQRVLGINRPLDRNLSVACRQTTPMQVSRTHVHGRRRGKIPGSHCRSG